MSEKKEYSVWVGGAEVIDYYRTKADAEILAQRFRDNGYDDVVVRKEEGEIK
jgi:hypothetical protein